VGAFLTLVDHPAPTPVWAAVAVAVVVTSTQQLGWLVASDAWPATALGWLRIPAVARSVPALAVGVAAGAAVAAYGITAGRPAYLWTIPAAAALGVLALAVTHWDREVPRWRPGALVLVAGLALALVGLGGWAGARARLSGSTTGEPATVVTVVLSMAGIVAVVLIVQVGQVWWHRVVVELSQARESLVAAVLREERLRFAGELHDVQGHELQVIMMRADLGETMLRKRGADGLTEASVVFRDIRDTAQAALQQTRAIAHGYRAVSFADEVHNSVPVLAAAGITVTVIGPVEAVHGELAHLAGLLVREAATNILRHSRTDRVRIEVTAVGDEFDVSVVDAGPRRASGAHTHPGSGLSSLADRAERLGYRVTGRPDGDGWSVRLTPGRDR
jgi:two-component system sensor histidine kinase DesK